MSKLTVFVIQVEGDDAAISAAMETARIELQKLIRPAAQTVDNVLPTVPAPQLIAASNGKVKKDHAVRVARQAESLEMETETEEEELNETGLRPGTLIQKAFAIIRDSTYGVTADEIHKGTGCATIQSAYQLCLELQNKGLVAKTPTGAWKTVNG